MFSLTSSPTSFVKYLKDPVRFISLGITLEAKPASTMVMLTTAELSGATFLATTL